MLFTPPKFVRSLHEAALFTHSERVDEKLSEIYKANVWATTTK
jgi:hypothetical protein